MKSRFVVSALISIFIAGTPAFAGYVGNDPINFTDPTGQFACEGDAVQCEAAQQSAADASQRLQDINTDISGIISKTSSGEQLTNYESQTMAALGETFAGVDLSNTDNLTSIQGTINKTIDILDPANTSVLVTTGQLQSSTLDATVVSPTEVALSNQWAAKAGISVNMKMGIIPTVDVGNEVYSGHLIAHEIAHVAMGQYGRFGPREAYGLRGISRGAQPGGVNMIRNADSFACTAYMSAC